MRGGRGFTLVEMLVVVAILAIATGALVLANGSAQRQAHARAWAVVQWLPQLAERAGRERQWYGVRVEPQQLQVLRLQGNRPRWQTVLVALPEPLPPGWQWELETVQAVAAEVASADGSLPPQLVLAGAWESTPYRLLLRPLHGAAGGWVVHSDGFNPPQLEALP